MTAPEIAQSASTDANPPSHLSQPLRAMWLAKAGKWDESHDLCQEIPGTTGSWIHAWLHREEGDQPNAEYWYARAGKPVPPRNLPLDQEWLQITEALTQA